MKLSMKAAGVFDHTIGSLAFLAGILMLFIMLAVCSDITARFVRGGSFIWVMEVSEYSLLWITFLGTTWLLRKEKHVVMDIVINRLTPKVQRLTNIITSIVCAILCLVVTWYGVEVVWEYFQEAYFIRSPLNPPYSVLLAIIPIGCFLLFIQFLRRTYTYLKS